MHTHLPLANKPIANPAHRFFSVYWLLCGCFALQPFACSHATEAKQPLGRQRPSLFVTREKIDGLRSLAEVRSGIQQGHAAKLWQQLQEKVDQQINQPPITMPDRNRSYTYVAKTSFRIIDCSLVALVKNDRRYAEAALAQIEVLFDESLWPDWRDKAHIAAGLNADLRHGQLVRAIALAYDWLYELLTEDERRRILAGLDRCALPQFKAGLAANEHWSRRHSNWMTCLMGGYGILGMALGSDHPDSQWLVQQARPRMDKYMTIFGPEGEFNESVQYSGSTMYVVDYFTVAYYASAGQQNPLQQHGLADYCRWYMYATVPPGRVFGFGDPAPDMPPNVWHLAAIASGLQDPVIQWFYLQYADLMLDGHRQRALELLFYDPTLTATPPDNQLPLGRAYHHQARLISSRNSWNPQTTTSVVYAKAGKEDYHCHADWGQVCIDGFGQRLIVDLGSPPGGYPKSNKEQYFNYQQAGHNVLVIGETETGGITWRSRQQGKTIWADFDDTRGAAWTMELSEVYGQDRKVQRHVVHLLPRVAVVLDVAQLPTTEPISLRWHTITPPKFDTDGNFTVQAGSTTLAGYTSRLDGQQEITTGYHQYRPPFDKNRYGTPLRQTRPPFVEIRSQANHFRCLSLFCIFGKDEKPTNWHTTANGWSIETPEGKLLVHVKDDQLNVHRGDLEWNVLLKK